MITRRHLLYSGLAAPAASLWPVSAFAAPEALTWSNLKPDGGPAATAEDLLPHDESGEFDMTANQAEAPTRPELDGREIVIRGYLVPIGYKPGSNGQSIAGFLLAPFVGACVHVPPPPANQIILGNYPDGLEMSSRIWFDPVMVTGILSVDAIETSIARIGYRIEASHVTF